MIAGEFTLASLLILTALAESTSLTPLTPDTMSDHGFQVKCAIYDPTANGGTQPPPATGLVLVRAHFDPMQGPAIKDVVSAYVVVRDGDTVLVQVPVQVVPYAGNDGGVWVRSWVQRAMLPKVQVVLHTRSGSFTIEPKAFIEKK